MYLFILNLFYIIIAVWLHISNKPCWTYWKPLDVRVRSNEIFIYYCIHHNVNTSTRARAMRCKVTITIKLEAVACNNIKWMHDLYIKNSLRLVLFNWTYIYFINNLVKSIIKFVHLTCICLNNLKQVLTGLVYTHHSADIETLI